MHAFAHQIAERGVDFPLPFDTAQPREGRTFDNEGEVTFAARIMACMADMQVALILEIEAGRRQRCDQPLDHFAGDRSGGSVRHHHYIEVFEEWETSGDTADQVARTG